MFIDPSGGTNAFIEALEPVDCRCLDAVAAFAVPAQAGQVYADQALFAALGRDVKFTVYVPDGYQADASVNYPVVYLLHGAGDHKAAAAEGASDV